MITAVDTNVLLDVLLPNNAFFQRSVQALEAAAAAGGMVICDLVYAELCAHFSTQRECDGFLAAVSIGVEALTRTSHFAVSRAWRRYRRQGGRRTRIVPDFLIGAHAQFQAQQLLTRDRGFYRRLFPTLVLVDPSLG